MAAWKHCELLLVLIVQGTLLILVTKNFFSPSIHMPHISAYLFLYGTLGEYRDRVCARHFVYAGSLRRKYAECPAPATWMGDIWKANLTVNFAKLSHWHRVSVSQWEATALLTTSTSPYHRTTPARISQLPLLINFLYPCVLILLLVPATTGQLYLESRKDTRGTSSRLRLIGVYFWMRQIYAQKSTPYAMERSIRRGSDYLKFLKNSQWAWVYCCLAIKAFLMDIHDLGLEHGDLWVVLLTERWLSHMSSRFSC